MVTDIKFEAIEADAIVSLELAKKQLRIEDDFTDEDDLIQAYIDAAIAMSEDYTGGHIVEKNMILKMDAFDNPLVFEAFPIQSIDSVSYYPADGSDSQVMDNSNYDLMSLNPKVSKISFKTTPAIAERFDAVTVTVKVGMVVEEIRQPIIQAILLQISDMYERREDRTEVMLSAATALLRPYKKF